MSSARSHNATEKELAVESQTMGSQRMENPAIESLEWPEWQKLYQEALVELDKDILTQRVTAAEVAIFRRLQALSPTRDRLSERHAIEDALAILRILKQESLGFRNLTRQPPNPADGKD